MAGANNAQMKAAGHSPRYIENVRATVGRVSSMASLKKGMRAMPLRRTLPTKPGVYRVAVSGLRDVISRRFDDARVSNIRKAYAEGKERELPPIEVRPANKRIRDGNHRLEVARELGAKSVLVRVIR